MPLKHLPLDWCEQNTCMKAISYILNPLGWCGQNMKALSYIAVMYTFKNFNTAVNDKV